MSRAAADQDAPPAPGPKRLDSAGSGASGLVLAGTLATVGMAAGERFLALAGAAGALVVLAVVRFELFVLAVLVARATLDATKAGGPVEPTTALGAAVLVLVLAQETLQRANGRGRPALSAPFRLPLQLFLAASVISALGSADVAASLEETLRLAGVLAMVLALERSMDLEAGSRRVLVAVFLSALGPLVLAGVQLAQGSGRQIGAFSRITGTFAHPNPFSIYLAIIIVLAVAVIPWVVGRTRWALILLVLASCTCLLLTYTRGSWIALVLGLLVVGVLQSRALVALVVATAMALVVLVPSVTARFADLETETRYSGAAGNSLAWRTDYWREALALSDDSPLTGIGLKGITRSTDEANNAHNDLVRVYVETGLLGLLAYLALGAALLATARRALRATPCGWRRGVAVGFAGVLTVIAVVSLSSNVITQVVLLWYVVAVAMVAVAVAHRPPAGPVQPGGAPLHGIVARRAAR